jgi:ribosome biogenesis GTPase A
MDPHGKARGASIDIPSHACLRVAPHPEALRRAGASAKAGQGFGGYPPVAKSKYINRLTNRAASGRKRGEHLHHPWKALRVKTERRNEEVGASR